MGLTAQFLWRAAEAALAIFVTINPFVWLPLFLHKTQTFDQATQRRWGMAITCTVTTVVSLSFAFGRLALHLLGLQPSWLNAVLETGWFEATVGILFVILGSKSLFSNPNKVKLEPKPLDFRYALIPLTFPLLAGPPTIAAGIYYASLIHSLPQSLAMAGAIVASGLGVGLIFTNGARISHRLGTRGLMIYRRVNALLFVSVGTLFLVRAAEAF